MTNDRPEAHLREKERLYLANYLRFGPSGDIECQPFFFNLNVQPDITRKYWGLRPVSNRTIVCTIVSEYG